MTRRYTTSQMVDWLSSAAGTTPVVITYGGDEFTTYEAWLDEEAGVYRLTLEPHVEPPMSLDELAERIVSLEGDRRFAQQQADMAETLSLRKQWLHGVSEIATVLDMAYSLFRHRLGWPEDTSTNTLSTEARRRFDLMYPEGGL